MTITTLDGLIAAMPGQLFGFSKAAATSKGAGNYHSLWKVAGNPSAGATPATGSGAVPTSATTGALKFTNPTGGALSYLNRFVGFGTNPVTLTIYDRLVATSGLSGTSTSEQTINSTALTRATTGAGVQAWIEWYTATGVSAPSFTFKYTNDAGTTGQVTAAQAIAFSPAAGTMQRINLNGSDGIRVAESITLAGSTGTAGDFGITLLKPILTMPLAIANLGAAYDVFQTGMAQAEDNACLAFMVFTTLTSTGAVNGELTLIQG